MKSNAVRVRQLSKRPVRPRFALGAKVKEPDGGIGAIDAAFADLEAAIDAGVVDEDWFAGLDDRPRTPKSGVWYSVVLPDGAILAGELDLTKA